MAILNQKSVFLKSTLVQGKGGFNFEGFLNEHSDLQIFYFFDMISKIYSESISTENLPI
jgi:uncharacterized protein with ATP-grasp and redox domains